MNAPRDSNNARCLLPTINPCSYTARIAQPYITQFFGWISVQFCSIFAQFLPSFGSKLALLLSHLTRRTLNL